MPHLIMDYKELSRYSIRKDPGIEGLFTFNIDEDVDYKYGVYFQEVVNNKVYRLDFGTLPKRIKDSFNFASFTDIDIVTNRKNTDKIYVTLFSVAFEYSNEFPQRMLLMSAHDNVRKRLLRIFVNKYLDYILVHYDLAQVIDGEWFEYDRNENAEGIIFILKQYARA